jgi:Glycine/D-amino acid oxidases (deaminating)
MNYITENHKIPMTEECDVLVAGGGIAGISAALAAARAGANVILLEKEFVLGGLATAGLVTIYLPLCDGNGTQVSFGIAEELLRLSIKHGAEARYPKAWLENGTAEEKKNGPRFEVQYNPHIFEILAEQALKKEHVKIIYGTSACAVDMVDSKINAVLIENKSGRSAIKVKSVVDTTGDADICKFAKATTQLFKQQNVLAAWHYYLSEGNLKLKMLGFSDVPDDEKVGKAETHLVPKRFQGIEGEELSDMVMLSHDFILKEVLNCRKTDESYTPVTIATIPQIRMTRRIVGLYTLEESESHKEFDDSIGMISNWKKRGPVFQIPFRTLYGAEVDNLITAGRCISVADSMWDISRVIPACAVTGEAAGVAAAMTDEFKTLNIAKLQAHLTQNNVKIRF